MLEQTATLDTSAIIPPDYATPAAQAYATFPNSTYIKRWKNEYPVRNMPGCSGNKSWLH